MPEPAVAGAAISTRDAAGVRLRAVELVACRLHDRHGDDLGLAELPVGRELAPGDLLATEDGRLVRVIEFVPCTSPP